MKIHSFATLISFPFIILVIYFGYKVFYLEEPNQFIYLLIPVIIIAVIYTFSPQIDYYWYSKNPRELEKKEKTLLESISEFYNSLDEQKKIIFEKRIHIFTRAKDFKWVRGEQKELPQDMKIVIAAAAIQLTLEHDDFLYGKYDNYFVYNHPFPSPKMKFLHSVEVNHEDYMAIFNIEMVMNSQDVKNRYFNISLFAFSEIFIKLNPNKLLPEINSDFWKNIENISKIQKEIIINQIGYEPDSLYPVMITIFFMYPDNFKQYLPKEYDRLKAIFNLK